MINSEDFKPHPIREDLLLLIQERLSGDSVSASASEALIVEGVRQGMISRKKGATLLGLEDLEFRESFFARHEFFNEYTSEILAEDFKTIDHFNGSTKPRSL